jgi:type VI secretion system protein VasG
MAEISRGLFGRLNPLAYKAIESATVFCKLRGNPYVELVHWVHQILQVEDSDLHRIVRGFELNPSQLAHDITESLDRLPRGATSISDLSAHVEEAAERGWVYGSLLFGEAQVRTGHIIVGVLKTGGLRNALLGISRQFTKVKLDTLCDDFARVTDGSPESGMAVADRFRAAGEAVVGPTDSGQLAPAALQRQEALKRFSVDLTERARNGEIDPVVGRDQEIRQIVDILMRRRQNNPILTGEAGVGKTALAEGFAMRVAGETCRRHQGDGSGLGPRTVAGRREHEGGIREPPARRHRRSPGLAQTGDPIHRRGAHFDRRRRRCRYRRCRQSAEAGAGAGHIANHRRHDLGRIQKVF